METAVEKWARYYQPRSNRVCKDGAIPTHWSTNNFSLRHLRGKVMLGLFCDYQGQLVQHYTSNATTVTSPSYFNLLRIVWEQPSYQTCMRFSVPVMYCYSAALGHILYVSQFRRSRAFISRVYLISRTRLISPPVTTVPLDHSRRLSLQTLSDPTRKLKKWRMRSYSYS
jgi:hypothetical protein